MAREQAQVDTSQEFYLVHASDGGGEFRGNNERKQTLGEARALADEWARRGCPRVFIARVIEWAEVPVARGTFDGALLDAE